MPHSLRAALLALSTLLTAAAPLAAAGPLNPPAGAVTSTAKPLAEIEPRTAINAANTPGDADSTYRIAAPGSYYLTGNLAVVAAKNGIEIAASGVTIDLCGFQISGIPGGLAGISYSAIVDRITIRNGQILNCTSGVSLQGIPAVTVENVTVTGSASYGIVVGSGSRIINCMARSNQGGGIGTAAGSAITGCTAALNTGGGLLSGSGCTVASCTAYDNAGAGFVLNAHTAIQNCSAYNNTSTGFNGGIACTFSNCTASNNGGDGIIAGTDSSLVGCTANLNTGDGFDVSVSSLTACSAYDNVADGINAANGCTITGCTSRANDGDGIEVSSGCLVLNNACSFNGNNGDGAGIHATGADNRIEANTCASADRGFDVDAAGNILTRNTASGNTNNWDIVANNKCLVVLGVNAPAITGNSGGAALGSTDPNANFTY
jgi:parallel beta-helix repeat protein